MILTVAALLAYRKRRSSSLEPLTEEEEKDWKKRITRELENIQNGIREDVKPLELALLRCYSDTSPKKKKMGVDDPQPPPDSTTTTTSFRSDVRNEWIQAVFGTDFLSWDTTTTKQGVGLAQIPSFTSYGVKILPQKEEEKLGITLSRLALGLYVRQVTVGSEAWCAGVIPNSVLVSINGMCLLAESSKQALERIWQYEGQYHLQVENNTNTNYSQKMMMDQNNPKLSNIITHPIHMTLIHKGLLYTVTMLTNPPYGIDWSPCGNFALVKRTYAQGATAGVKRGAIIAKVNDKDIIYDGLDHTMCATELREAFQAGKEIQLQLCFTPSEARSGHSERQLLTAAQQQQQDEGGIRKRSKPTAQHDGVEVRVHPFFGNKNKNNHNNNHKTSRSSSNHKTTSITQLASRVAAGELYSLPKNTSMTCHKLYRPCPPMLQSLLEHWSREDSLLYLLFYHQSGYDEQEFIIRPNTKLLPYLRSTTQHNNDNNIAAADELMQTFLLPLIGFVSHDQKKNDDDDSLLLLLLVETAKSNIELAHRMELVAQALQNDTLKKSLLRLRKEREKEYYQQAASRTQQQSRNEDLACERAPPLLATVSGADYEQPCLTVATSTTTMASTIISPAPHVFKKGKTPKVFGFFRKRNRKKLGSITNSPKSIIKPRAAKQGSPKKKTNASEPLPVKNIPLQTSPTTEQPRPPSSDSLFSNTLLFLEELENVCTDIEKSLLRTFSQKIAGWALQPWSASKETALAQVTQVMRERLKLCQTLPLLNPIDSEMLVSLDPQGCYILPSAHFPLLLTFDCRQEDEEESKSIFGPEKLYRTKVELIALRGPSSPGRSFVIHGCVAGTVVESEKSVMADQGSSRWDKGNDMAFDTRSSWGAPKTMSLRLSEACQSNSSSPDGLCPTGFSWVNLAPLWKTSEGSITVSCKVWSPDSINNFDEHGDSQGRSTSGECLEITLRVTTKTVDLADPSNHFARKRSLLYKHDDDVRQEMFAIEFVKSCDRILKSCGLDMKLLTFRCIPVGQRRGFIEWVQGSVPLSEICQPFAGSILDRKKDSTSNSNDDAEDELSSVAKAGLTKYESLQRIGSTLPKATKNKDSVRNNPIQDYLRSCAYDPEDPYMIHKDVMEAYVKSCAGYCVITYILGVGDRHLDNLLLHQSGQFFHCDYSFILGNDPKQYLPVRMTEDMVNGMGGRDSDNFAMFLSLTCAAFLTLRRPENVRHLLSMVRLMENCSLPDVEENQSIEAAILGIRERFRLDLSEDQAISFMEKLIEDSCSSRMWIAVDAIHTLGKRF